MAFNNKNSFTLEDKLYIKALFPGVLLVDAFLLSLFLLQCRCGPHWLLHRHRHHAGHGREGGRGGHLQLRQGAALTEGQHGPDRGTVYPVRQGLKHAA